jgi:hypothetical protein
MAIDVDVKILCGLKMLAYGVSGSAFQDYFQMGESTALLCCENVARAISHDAELRRKYLRNAQSGRCETSFLPLRTRSWGHRNAW